jgi:membrane protease YdiL (CAAX protease family)
VVLKNSQRWSRHWRVAYAFFMASLAYPLTLFLSDWIGVLMGRAALSPDVSRGLAIGKVIEVAVIVTPVLILTRLSGADLGSVFLQRGNLKLGLGIGGLVFLNFTTSGLMFFSSRFTRMELLGDAIVWGLVFSLANGFMEELWLRGIFLKRFEPYLGMHGSVWLTALVFALMHSFAYYFMPTVLPVFVLNTMSLGLACGYLMMRSDSLWGAVLIHSAADLFLFLAVLANA